jgi:Ser/Thr protein kinase RdoA (MazF antagonist)
MQPSQAAREFDVPGRLVHVNSVGQGNVNDTYLAVFRAGGAVERIILQRINGKVFEHPDWIMANMRLLTDHCWQKLVSEPDDDTREWGIPKIVPSRKGEDFFIDEQGHFWRAMTIIDAASSHARVRSAEHAFEVGITLGCFHRLVSDLPSEKLHDTLPGFHVAPGYLEKYDRTVDGPVDAARLNSTLDVKRLIRFIEKRRDGIDVLEKALAAGELTTRTIHGDPKVDNIMIDEFTGYGIGIIDLDTAKPGLLHYDFGDALRSACNPAGEDELDLADVFFDVDLCRAIVSGYLAQAKDILTEADRYYLFDAIRLLAFELGLRFFQDYLAGDTYFKVRFEGHNLNRARVQFKLCESIEANEKAIRAALTHPAPDATRVAPHVIRPDNPLVTSGFP